MNDPQIIHPFCQVHYSDVPKLLKILYMVETFCPEFAATWDSVDSGDQATWEEVKKLVLDIGEDARTIKEHLNWSEKNEY